MKYSTIQWHLARDDQKKLAKFCNDNRVSVETRLNTYNDGEHDYFEQTYKFNNGGFITAELLHGDTRSYSVNDHFQVKDYHLGM